MRVWSSFHEVSAIFAFLASHCAFGSVADLLVPSSSRGTASASHAFPYNELQLTVCKSRLRNRFRRAGPLPVLPSILVFGSCLCSSVPAPPFCSSVVRGLAGVSFVFLWYAVMAGLSQISWLTVLQTFSSAKITSHKSSTLHLHQMSWWTQASFLNGKIMSFLIHVHWVNAGSCRSGHSSGSF